MKKAIKYLSMAMMSALTLTACSKEDIEPNAVSDSPTFSAVINGVHARATDDYWENGDEIGISEAKVANVCHVTEEGDGNFIVKDEAKQVFFSDANEVTFYAYYPWQDITGNYITVNVSDQSKQKSFDFLWASAKGSKSKPKVEFKFSHKMSKVTFVFKNGDNMDVSAINKIRLNGLVVEGSFDITTGNFEITEDTPPSPTTIALTDVRAEKPVTPLLLIPQTVAGTVKLEIYDSYSQYFVCNIVIPDSKLEAGMNYTYTITVNKNGLLVNSCTLSDWITTDGEDSEASSSDE